MCSVLLTCWECVQSHQGAVATSKFNIFFAIGEVGEVNLLTLCCIKLGARKTWNHSKFAF